MGRTHRFLPERPRTTQRNVRAETPRRRGGLDPRSSHLQGSGDIVNRSLTMVFDAREQTRAVCEMWIPLKNRRKRPSRSRFRGRKQGRKEAKWHFFSGIKCVVLTPISSSYSTFHLTSDYGCNIFRAYHRCNWTRRIHEETAQDFGCRVDGDAGLWSKPGLTAEEVVETLKGKVTWNDRTIRTLINRLLQKKALTYEKEGRRYRYRPAVSQEQCVKEERRSFIQRVYGGTAAPMLAAFIEDARLSAKDVEELKRMLDRKGKT